MDWKCPSCNGKGYLLVERILQNETNTKVRRYEHCQACEGTGFRKESDDCETPMDDCETPMDSSRCRLGNQPIVTDNGV